MAEYVEYFQPRNINDKTAVLENTARLNRMLHDNGIPEKLRSQFVGTCLLALKDGLIYKGLSTKQINAGIKEKLSLMLKDSIDKAKSWQHCNQMLLRANMLRGWILMDIINY